ncbi:MAG: alpha-amylase family glycosyl hydrolase [Candidatus Omnitrophica bacterium]|nr:alpha-amylase family glycosyl hydrolase [Candidatus Omnitrophota bacterium]MDD5670143.1 alpha-amylase family glycosyl hydrolase [Candidatus Omnitrophota bacterium]
MIRKYPHLLQVNASFLLSRMKAKYGQPLLTLATIPDEEWEAFADAGFDFVWLMGIWERSPKARTHALTEPNLIQAYNLLLPDWNQNDVGGSPYSIYGYHLDPFLGDTDTLAALKTKLHSFGLKLIVDFVPNHLAFDHPWTLTRPGCFVRGTAKQVKAHPEWYFMTERGVSLAHGRDPYFPPWIDTVQINFYASMARKMLIHELLKIAKIADGVRCDMAMLGLNGIFEKVWGRFIRNGKSKTEFWDEAIPEVKNQNPDFVFIAEVYWDLEWDLQQLGFDFTYDKRLYDRLLLAKAADVRGHLKADLDFQAKSMRFLENHDEDRAITTFGYEKSKAAAVVAATIPGLRFFQDGQLQGKRIRMPIHLRREAVEPVDSGILDFYTRLMKYAGSPALHDGTWELLELASAWEWNQSHQNVMAWCWRYPHDWKIIVVNYSDARSQGRVKIKMAWDENENYILFRDRMTGEIFMQDRNELESFGLYVDLAPWQAHLFEPT